MRSEERRGKDFFAMRGWWWCGRVISPAQHKWRPTRGTRVTDRWAPIIHGPTRRWVVTCQQVGVRGGRYLYSRAGAVGCGEEGGRSPPGAADMALIFSGAQWHGCMVIWGHGIPMACIITCPWKIVIWTSLCEEIMDGPYVLSFGGGE